MKNSVIVMDNIKQWDPDTIARDWYEKVLPHLPKTALIPAVFAENQEEEQFTYVRRPVINQILVGTVFEDVIKSMPFNINRAIFVYIPEGMCLRHHNDPDDKYHLSVIENPGSFYYNYDTQKGYHLPADGRIRRINSSRCHHTAVNGGVEGRVHLVITEHEYDDYDAPQLYHFRWNFDYSEAKLGDIFTGKRDIASTIEQNFTIPLTQYAYRTRKVCKLQASNIDSGRMYNMYWSSQAAVDDFINSDIFWTTCEVLKQFNIRLKYEFLY